MQALDQINQQQLRLLFRAMDTDHDGQILMQKLRELAKDLEKPPKPYQITQLFQALGDEVIKQDQFIIWYMAYMMGYPKAAFLKFQLNKIEQKINSASPPIPNEQIRNSEIILSIENNQNVLKNQLSFQISVGRQMAKNKIEFFNSLFNRQIQNIFIGLTFKIKSNAETVRSKLNQTIQGLVEVAKQLVPQSIAIFDILQISVGGNQEYVAVIIETKFPVLLEISKAFQSLIVAIYPKASVFFEASIKSQSLNNILQDKAHLNGFQASLKLQIDATLHDKLKDFIKEEVQKTNNYSPDQWIPMLLLMFEEARIHAKFSTPAQLLGQLNIPTQFGLKQQAQNIKQNLNLKQLISNFLPPTVLELIDILKGVGIADIQFSLNSSIVNISLQAKLTGIKQIVDLFL